MAYSAWVASNPYTVGQIARATTVHGSGLVFRCTVAGTSAATEPAWPTDIGSTIVDGRCIGGCYGSVFGKYRSECRYLIEFYIFVLFS